MAKNFDPIVELIQGVYVVRDDFIAGGSKRRFVGGLLKGAAEVVYASPVYGGAQIAIAHAAAEAGIRATIFCAKRKTPHPRTLEAKAAGAKIIQVPCGYLSVVKSRATEYCRDTGAKLLPFGLESETAFEAIGQAARLVSQQVGELDQVWAVAGSGVLIRGLQRGLKAKQFHAVQVGRELSQADVGKAIIHVHPLPFEKDARVKPPFPSCSNYDAKAWEFIKTQASGKVLFWNVMA